MIGLKTLGIKKTEYNFYLQDNELNDLLHFLKYLKNLLFSNILLILFDSSDISLETKRKADFLDSASRCMRTYTACVLSIN